MIVTAGLFHPSLFAQIQLVRRLRAVAQRCGVSSVHWKRGLRGLQTIAPGIRLLVLYFQRKRPDAPIVKALDEYVASGGALFAFHSAAASFKGDQCYANLLGGVFISHAPVAELTIKRVYKISASAGGMDQDSRERFTVRDEPYLHRLTRPVDVRYRWLDDPIATQGGEGEPISWRTTHGAGRVYYLALGHRAKTFDHDGVKEVIRDGFAWCAGEDE